jgi:tRNA nucleotidyltransferase (CCA-adding enzyme)
VEPLPPNVDVNAFVVARLEAVLPPGAMSTLRLAARQAAERGWAVYLVGGYVRDCLLKIPDYDIDVSVEGDAPVLARMVAAETGAQVEVHGTFGTALLTWGPETADFDIDLVTARRETYERPGALPTVEPGTILDDLARRDFTVNAMAVRLESEHTGPLLDPHGGLADLQAGVLRVLHDRSFLDDPTRIFRAIRLSMRLGFDIEEHTGNLIWEAIQAGALDTVSTDRITHELRLIWREPLGDEVLFILDRTGVLEKIHPDLRRPVRSAHEAPAQIARLYPEDRKAAHLAALGFAFDGDVEAAHALARHLRLDAHETAVVRDAASLAAVWPRLLDAQLQPSGVRRMLAPLHPEALEAFRLVRHREGEMQAMAWLEEYLTKLRHIRPELTGDYLRSLGVPAGPVYREALGALLDAKLDGKLPTRNDEERFLQAWLKGRGLLPEGA